MPERPRIPTQHLIGPPDSERRLRLLEIVRQRARERHYADRTIATYVYWIRRYILHFDRRHPRELGPDEVREFIGRLSASSHNQALAALTFLYVHVLRAPFDHIPGIVPARRPRREPIVLSVREVGRVVNSSTNRFDSVSC